MTTYTIAAQAPDDIASPVPDPLLASSLFHALFWKPRFLIDSPVTVHVPLFYWLSCVLRPQRVSILGAGDGMAHFAFCQALDRLGTSGQCETFGFWQDAAAGDSMAPPPARLSEHQQMLYDDLATLRSCASLNEAFEQMKPGTVDLLFCDLSALPENSQVSGEMLLTYLSRPGILLLHGLDKARQDQADIRAMSRFLDQRHHVVFPDGNTLTLLCSADALPAPLQALIDLSTGGRLRRDIEQIFRRSGQGLYAIAAQTAHVQARQKTEKCAGDAQKTVKQLREELKALQESHDLQSVKLAQTQREVFDLRQELDEVTNVLETCTIECNVAKVEAEAVRHAHAEASTLLEAARSNLEAERKTRVEEAEALSKAESALTSAQANAEAAKAQLQAERYTRFEETAALTRISEDLHKKIDSDAKAAEAKLQAERQESESKLNALNNISEELRKEIKGVQRQKDRLQSYNQELLNSTSWRMTAPMRAIKNKFKL